MRNQKNQTLRNGLIFLLIAMSVMTGCAKQSGIAISEESPEIQQHAMKSSADMIEKVFGEEVNLSRMSYQHGRGLVWVDAGENYAYCVQTDKNSGEARHIDRNFNRIVLTPEQLQKAEEYEAELERLAADDAHSREMETLNNSILDVCTPIVTELVERAFADGRTIVETRCGFIMTDSEIAPAQQVGVNVHMSEGACYTITVSWPQLEVFAFTVYPLGWHSCLYGYTDPAEASQYPSVEHATGDAEVANAASGETLAPLFDMRAMADDSVQAALYHYFRNVCYGEEWFDARAAEGTKICVYAVRDYGAGTLAVADFYIGGELAPDLYYVEDGAVRSATTGSDCWAINYTRMDGDTIVYGKSFAWDGAPMATTHATAAFSDGMIETVDMIGAQGGDLPGFLFVNPNEVWLDTLTLYDGDTVAANQDSGEFTMTEMRNRFAKNAPLCQWTRFNPMLDAAARERRFLDAASSTMQVALVGDEAAGLLRWYKDSSVAFPDLWRTLNNGLPTTVASNQPVLLDGLNREDASALYWVELARDDGTAAGVEQAVQSGGEGLDSRVSGDEDEGALWSIPGAPGHEGLYVLVLDYGECWYTALFDVEGRVG